jgi:hypothetical protein
VPPGERERRNGKKTIYFNMVLLSFLLFSSINFSERSQFFFSTNMMMMMRSSGKATALIGKEVNVVVRSLMH